MPSELQYTGPNALCPHPEWWHAPDAEATEHEVTLLVGSLVRALQPELVVETGTYLGHTARAIGLALKRNGHGRLVTLEVDESCVFAASEAVKDLPVTVLQLSSLEYSPEGPVGFAWFDSRPDIRTQEFLRYYPFLEKIVGFHDTGPQHSLRPDIEAVAASGHLRPVFLPTPRGVCIAEVLRR